MDTPATTDTAGRPAVYRTVITFEVFTREQPYQYGGITQLAYDITDGEAIGGETVTVAGQVPPDQIVDSLKRIGNDGTFFDDDLYDNDDPATPPA